jgi:hypothetical protein
MLCSFVDIVSTHRLALDNYFTFQGDDNGACFNHFREFWTENATVTFPGFISLNGLPEIPTSSRFFNTQFRFKFPRWEFLSLWSMNGERVLV